MPLALRPAGPSQLRYSTAQFRTFTSTRRLPQQQQRPQQAHAPETRSHGSTNFYRTHGRPMFKALTLAFFSYQVVYWAWLTLETEEIKHGKNREIAGLEEQVRLLDEARKTAGKD